MIGRLPNSAIECAEGGLRLFGCWTECLNGSGQVSERRKRSILRLDSSEEVREGGLCPSGRQIWSDGLHGFGQHNELAFNGPFEGIADLIKAGQGLFRLELGSESLK